MAGAWAEWETVVRVRISRCAGVRMEAHFVQ